MPSPAWKSRKAGLSVRFSAIQPSSMRRKVEAQRLQVSQLGDTQRALQYRDPGFIFLSFPLSFAARAVPVPAGPLARACKVSSGYAFFPHPFRDGGCFSSVCAPPGLNLAVGMLRALSGFVRRFSPLDGFAVHYTNSPSMRVLQVASEAVPLAKTGGLGDVVTALSTALASAGVVSTVLLPGYPQVMAGAWKLRRLADLPDLPGGPATLMLGRLPDGDVPLLVLRNEALYGRMGGLYQDDAGQDYPDNHVRFAALGHAAALIGSGKLAYPPPDIVHGHDWHAGLAPLLLKESARVGGKPVAKSITTIHNLAFHGNFPMETAAALGVPASALTADGAEFWGQLSFLKAGIRFADCITTVSRTYAREILTPEFGCGFDGLLNSCKERLAAIANGIDKAIWDPARDEHLPKTFSLQDLSGKHACKRELQQCYGLPVDPFAPVLAMGSRLTTQKMADVAIEAIARLLKAHPRLQAVVLGRGEPELERGYRLLQEYFPQRLGLHIGYDERRAHLLHAGSDMLLHGSRFEPCGLTPLYAMQYGTVPVASRVGGLADNIVDAGEDEAPAAGATGFLFDGDTVEAMCAAVERALARIADPKAWRVLQRNGMSCDFGWDTPAAQYAELYRQLAPEPRADVAPRPDVAAATAAAAAARADALLAPAKEKVAAQGRA
jgi:starch synthase